MNEFRKVVDRETVMKVKGVLQRVPLVGALEHIPAKGRIGEYHNSPMTFPLGNAETELVNRMFFGLQLSEDAGRDRVFNLTIQKWTLEDGEWFIHLLFRRARRKTPLAKLVVMPRGRKDEGDVSLTHNGFQFLRVAQVNPKDFVITCGTCGQRCFTGHGLNPKFAHTNKEARATGKERWSCPDCLPREPKKAPMPKEDRPPRRRPSPDSRQLEHLQKLARR